MINVTFVEVEHAFIGTISSELIIDSWYKHKLWTKYKHEKQYGKLIQKGSVQGPSYCKLQLITVLQDNFTIIDRIVVLPNFTFSQLLVLSARKGFDQPETNFKYSHKNIQAF